MQHTEHLNMNLPEPSDFADIAKLNENFERLDILSPADIGAVPDTRKVNGKALSEDITLTAEDIGALNALTGGNVIGDVHSRGYGLFGADIDQYNRYVYIQAYKDETNLAMVQVHKGINDDYAGVMFFDLVNGVCHQYEMYHEGNLTPARIGALPLYANRGNEDYNNLITAGVYQCQGLCPNGPLGAESDTHFYVQVFWHHENWIKQIAYNVRNPEIFERAKTNGTWGEWSCIMDSSGRAYLATTAIFGTSGWAANTYYARNEGFFNYEVTPTANSAIAWQFS